MMTQSSRLSVLALLLLAVPAAAEAPNVSVFPTQNTQVIHLVQWTQPGDPAAFLLTPHARTGQPPLSANDVVELVNARIATDRVIGMIEERRCNADVSARALVRLKKKGVPDAVIAAMSQHALTPNHQIDLDITIDTATRGQVEARDYLYVFIDDVEQTRSYTAAMADLLTPTYSRAVVDRSDVLIDKPLRRSHFAGSVPLKTSGSHTLLVALSKKPGVTHPSALSPAEFAAAKVHTFDYPLSSLGHICRLNVSIERDVVLVDALQLRTSQLTCEWD